MDDIRLKQNDIKFKFRVAGIVEIDNKVLVVKMNDNPFYCFPGGHVELLEDTEKATQRELDEELYFKAEVEKLLYIYENFFNEKGYRFHELCFYYLAKPTKKDFIPKDTEHEELDKGQLVHHCFKWINISELEKEKIEPKIIVEKLFNSNGYQHIITNEL